MAVAGDWNSIIDYPATSPNDVTTQKHELLSSKMSTQGLDNKEEQAARAIQRYYRGYRTRRELQGWSLNSSTRWLEAIKEAQWHQSMQVQRPSGNDGEENNVIERRTEEGQQVVSRQSQQRGHDSELALSPEVRKKWKLAGQVALRAGGDDNVQDKVAEESIASSSETHISDMRSSSGAGNTTTSLHNFQYSSRKRQSAVDVEKTAKMMDLQYFLEMVDTKHRYGSNLRAYHSVWKNGPSKQNFFYWLDYGDGKDVEIERVPRDRLEREQVRYLSREERQHYLLVLDDEGRFRWAKNGERVWTDSEHYRDSIKGVVSVEDKTPTFREYTADGDEVISNASNDSSNDTNAESSDEEVKRYVNPDYDDAKGVKKIQYVSPAVIFNQLMQKSLRKKDKWIFVADTSYRLYVGIKESGAFQHSSFLRGARISAAGLIKIKDGQLRSLSPLSGHYRPPAANFRAFVHALQQQGVDMSGVSISRSYAVLVGIEGYMKFKQKKKIVKDKIDEEKSKALNKSAQDKDDQNSGNIYAPSRRSTQKNEDTTNGDPSAGSTESNKSGFLSGLMKTITRKDTDQESKTTEIRGRGIPGTAPEEGVPAPEGRR